jgi:hypothetical protein
LHSQNAKRSVGKSVNTPPFHGGMTGSTPVRSTKEGFKLQSPGLVKAGAFFLLTDRIDDISSHSNLSVLIGR